MERKEELVILINQLYKKIYDKSNCYRDAMFKEKVKSIGEITLITNQLNKYIAEYESLKKLTT